MKHKSTRDRIYNWARWARGGTPTPSSTSMTGMICDRMRIASEGALVGAGSGTGVDRLDSDDAASVERAWKRLSPVHREMLRWHYIRNARPDIICRRLGIKPRPTTIFDIELARAEAELARVMATQASEAPGLARPRMAS